MFGRRRPAVEVVEVVRLGVSRWRGKDEVEVEAGEREKKNTKKKRQDGFGATMRTLTLLSLSWEEEGVQ